MLRIRLRRAGQKVAAGKSREVYRTRVVAVDARAAVQSHIPACAGLIISPNVAQRDV